MDVFRPQLPSEWQALVNETSKAGNGAWKWDIPASQAPITQLDVVSAGQRMPCHVTFDGDGYAFVESQQPALFFDTPHALVQFMDQRFPTSRQPSAVLSSASQIAGDIMHHDHTPNTRGQKHTVAGSMHTHHMLPSSSTATTSHAHTPQHLTHTNSKKKKK